MRLLVLTPTLGVSPWLEETIASVKTYSNGGIHVFIATTECERLPVSVGRTIHDPARGMYAAINEGLKAVPDWDAFTYINDDDRLLPGFLAVLAKVATAAKDRRPLVAYGRVRLIDAAGRNLGFIPVSPRPALNRTLYAERLEPVYQHGTVFTRAVWERHGGFDESLRYCGDSEYLARLCVHGVPVERVRATVAAFRLRPGQLTKRREEMMAERALVDTKLGLLSGPGRMARLWARMIFRTANLPVYAERIARHGFVSFDQVLERTG